MLRHLNTDEMVSLTTVWAINPQAKALFLSIPEIAPLYPRAMAVNAELLALQPIRREISTALQKVIAEANEIDGVYDALSRATFHGIEAERCFCLAAVPAQRARAAQLEKLRATMFPNGLAIVNASYLAEAGNTARLATLLDNEPHYAALLESIPVRDGGTLLDLVRRWILMGEKLGQLEHERSVLMARDATRAASPTNLAQMRARWLRVVSQVLSTLELSEASPEAIETIRGPVLRASERAGLRYVDRTPSDEPTDEETDEPTDEDDDLAPSNDTPQAPAA